MANTTPTPASISRVVYLCYIAVFQPTQFEALEREDNVALNSDKSLKPSPGIYGVRKSFKDAAAWGMSAVACGAFAAWIATFLFEPAAASITLAACIGTAILLWATLALKGWDIQSIGGVTLTERVNRWWFRGLYWLGTMLIVMAAVWGLQ